jgi:hypothetical protein
MTKLDDLNPNAAVGRILPDCVVTVVSVKWFGTEAVELTYADPAGRPENTLLHHGYELRLEIPKHEKLASAALAVAVEKDHLGLGLRTGDTEVSAKRAAQPCGGKS